MSLAPCIFYLWFKFSFLLFLGMVMYDNDFKTKENKIQTKDKIELQHYICSMIGIVDGTNRLSIKGRTFTKCSETCIKRTPSGML